MHEGKVQAGIYDNIWTPKYAVDPLLKHIQVKGKKVWEPTGDDTGRNGIFMSLLNAGAEVIWTGNEDFFSTSYDCDMIITNPPYSKKTQFLQHAYNLGKPFAMLMPITTLEGVERNHMFDVYGIQVLVLNKRVNFTGGKGSWFNVSWFCWNLLPNDLMFEELIIDKKRTAFEKTQITQVW